MKYTPETTPVSVKILSRHESIEDGRKQFNFTLELDCDGRKAVTKYMGGCRAFGGHENIHMAEIMPAQVIYSLIMDAQCSSESFEDFCFNCGYDTDSRKALDTYLACQESGRTVRKLLGKEYSDVEAALADY